MRTMERIRFTKARLNELLALKSDSPAFKYFTDQSGMSVQVRSTSRGSTILFMFKKRYHGKLHVKSIGGYPVISLDNARIEFNRILGQLIQTGSVLDQEKEVNNKVLTMSELIQEFLDFKAPKISQQTLKNYHSYSRHFDAVKDMKITDINAVTLKERIFDHLIDKPGVLNQVRAMAKSLGQYAYAMEYTATNPFAKLNMLVDTAKIEHFATFADDELDTRISEVFEKIKDAPFMVRALIHFHFLVPLRNAEVRSIEVNQVDNGQTEVTVKTKTWEQFTMPLNTQAQRLIKLIIANGDKGYLFHSPRSSTTQIYPSAANLYLKRYGIENFVIHSTRSCAMQFLVKQTDIKETVASMCLAHKVGNKTEQAYNRGEYLEERRHAMQLWGDFIEKCAGKNIFY